MKKYTSKDKARMAYAWIKALRSGKFEQTAGALIEEDGDELGDDTKFCCLGVACEVLSKKGYPLVKTKTGYRPKHGGSRFNSLPTKRVANAIGFRSRVPNVKTKNVDLLSSSFVDRVKSVSLVELNDDHGFDFNDIADVIERNLDDVFEPRVARYVGRLLAKKGI